jgi:hypothetical protein
VNKLDADMNSCNPDERAAHFPVVAPNFRKSYLWITNANGLRVFDPLVLTRLVIKATCYKQRCASDPVRWLFFDGDKSRSPVNHCRKSKKKSASVFRREFLTSLTSEWMNKPAKKMAEVYPFHGNGTAKSMPPSVRR